MERSSTNEVSFEERLAGITVGVLILMSNDLKKFVSENVISEEDFRTTLDWFQDWNFDIPFILAKYNYFDLGINYAEAEEIVLSIQEEMKSSI